jgi:hypothetical protein
VKYSTCFVLVSLTLTAALPSLAQQPSTAPQSSTAPATAPSSTPAETPAAPASPFATSTTATSTTATSATATSTTATSATTQAPASADKTGPSADLIKRAKNAGMTPEQRHGQTYFCWTDASIGSRFVDKKCTDEAGAMAMLNKREQEGQEIRQLKTGTSSH